MAVKRTPHQRGFSLVELLVAVAIGLVLTLAITLMLANSQGQQRTLTSTNDVDQTGAYVSYVMDRLLRSAGSGYSQRWSEGYGCLISASRSGTAILPVPAGQRPAEFISLPTNVRLAPLIIHAGGASSGSDALAVMTGASGLGESPLRIQAGSITSTSLRLANTLGIRADDVVMLMEPGVGCMVQQVASGFTGSTDQLLSLGGTYYAATSGSASIAAYGVNGSPMVVQLGNATGNTPQMQWIGVGGNDTLYTYDLLRLAGATTSLPLAEGVADLRAVYGLDTDSDGDLDTWQSPATAPFNAATLLDGSAASAARLRSIVAVRIGLIMRTTLVEKSTVSPASMTLFSTLGSSFTYERTLTTDERRRRHRSMEFTVPLRNNIML